MSYGKFRLEPGPSVAAAAVDDDEGVLQLGPCQSRALHDHPSLHLLRPELDCGTIPEPRTFSIASMAACPRVHKAPSQPSHPFPPRNRSVQAPATAPDYSAIASTLSVLTKIMNEALFETRPANEHHPVFDRHLSPNFSARMDFDLPRRPQNRADHLADWADQMLRMPDFSVEILDSVAEVADDGRRARVWAFKRLRGISGHDGALVPRPRHEMLTKEGVTCLTWECRAGVWLLSSVSTMRGVSLL